MFTALIFYMFAGLAIASGVMVISSRNPVHSVLWLILAFFNAAGLFLLLGAEFLAMVLVIVAVLVDLGHFEVGRHGKFRWRSN